MDKVYVLVLTCGMLAAGARAAVPTDSLGEGTCVGFVPVAADTIKDTSFHPGDTIVLSSGDVVVCPLPEEREEAALPSVNTTVEIVAGDGFAHGRVTQVFTNPFDLPFEATYIFPLPHDGAVHAMDFRTSTGVYHADLLEKEEAKQKYEEAKQEGKQASLLMQGQDNIFVQKLCNILPHDSVSVVITFSMALAYDMGGYELSFPTTMIPRYDPASLSKRLRNPTYVPSDRRDGGTLDFSIAVLSGNKIDNLTCASHDVAQESGNLDGTLQSLGILEANEALPAEYNATLVRLTAQETIPNRDIVVRWKRGASERSVSCLSYNDGTQGYFAMNIFPDMVDTVNDRPQSVDMVFVVDKSGSMSGSPMTKAKEIMHAMLDKARPDDRVSFLAFNSSTDSLFSVPAPATAENIALARDWVDNLVASGGTEMLKGVQQALEVPLAGERARVMALITDGAIGDVDAIYQAISDDPSNTIVFAFGVGSSPNRELIDGASTAGNGVGKNLLLSDNVEDVVADFWTRIRLPQVADISIDWGGETPTGLTKGEIPGLWLGQPILLFGKYTQGGPRTITLNGLKNGSPVSESFGVHLVRENTVMLSVPKMWARETMENLRNEQVARGDESNKDTILALSLEHEVLCEYTAFLAVADSVVNEDGEMVAADVPIPVPDGVDPYMSGADMYNSVRGAPMATHMIFVDSASEPAPVEEGITWAVEQEPRLELAPTRNGVMFTLRNVPPARMNGTVSVYDAFGRVVAKWALEELGGPSWTWRFTDNTGNPVSRGMYVIIIREGALSMARAFLYR